MPKVMLDEMVLESLNLKPKLYPLPSKDSYFCFKAFGPKDPITSGFLGAILMLRERKKTLNP